MWLNRKREKDKNNLLKNNLLNQQNQTINSSNSSINQSITNNSDFNTNLLIQKNELRSSKKNERTNGIRKKILQFGARVQGHSSASFTSQISTESNDNAALNTKELPKHNETKNNSLFLQQLTSCKAFYFFFY